MSKFLEDDPYDELIGETSTQVKLTWGTMTNGHAQHMKELFQIMTELPGMDTKVNEQQYENIVFGSFPFK